MITDKKKIQLSDGTQLSLNIVENGSPVWIVVNHGLGEHAGRHSYFYSLFSQYFNICIYDLRGHGESEGKRAFINPFNQFVDDLDEVINYLKSDYSMKKYILFGHSMGGLIAASYMQNKVSSEFYPEKVFLSGPATGGAGLLGDILAMTPAKFLQSLKSVPASLSLAGLIDISKLSHDPRVYEAYINDPLCSLKVHTKLLLEILYAGRQVFSRPLRVKCDLFCALGSADVVVDHTRAKEYFKNIEKNCKLLVVDGGYHELHNEIEKYRDQYFNFLKESFMESI